MTPLTIDALPTTLPPSPSATSAIGIERLASSDHEQWDRFIDASDDGSLFHTTAWMESVRAGFGHRAIYLLAKRDEQIVGVLPLFEIHSLIGGTLLVSVPYGVYGGPIGEDLEALRRLRDETCTLARSIGARAVDLRSVKARWTGTPVVDRHVTFRKALPRRAADCLDALPRKARAAARIARERHGLAVSFDDAHLHTVWRLYCANMRRLGSLNYPFAFFDELIRRTPGGHLVCTVRDGAKPIAGLITFLHKGVAMPYFVGAADEFRHQNVYNLIYLSAMEQAVERGCHTFDFGRSRRDNIGACAFKKNQGFEPTPLEYQLHTVPGCVAPDLSPSNPRFALARRVWPMLPGIFTRRVGGWITRHIPG